MRPIFHTETAPQNERQCTHVHLYLKLGVTSFTYSLIPTDNWPSWYGDDLEAPNNKKFMKKIEQFQPFSDMDNYVLEERYLSLTRVIETLK